MVVLCGPVTWPYETARRVIARCESRCQRNSSRQARSSIPAGGEQRITLQTTPGVLGIGETAITLESEGFRQSLPVRIFAVPASLHIEPREGLDFGEIEPRKRYRGFLRVKNEGGSAARLQAKTPLEVLLVPDPSSAVLQPGETRVFEVAFEVSSRGSYQSEITISSSGAKPVTIPVVGNDPYAQLVRPKRSPRKALSSAMQPTPVGDRSSARIGDSSSGEKNPHPESGQSHF